MKRTWVNEPVETLLMTIDYTRLHMIATRNALYLTVLNQFWFQNAPQPLTGRRTIRLAPNDVHACVADVGLGHHE